MNKNNFESHRQTPHGLSSLSFLNFESPPSSTAAPPPANPTAPRHRHSDHTPPQEQMRVNQLLRGRHSGEVDFGLGRVRSGRQELYWEVQD